MDVHDLVLPYVLPLLLGTGLAGILAVLAWYRRPTPGAATFAYLVLSLALWCLAYALALSVSEPYWEMMLSKLRYVGIVPIPVLWLVLALQYTGRQRFLTWQRVAALLVLPALTEVLVWHPSSRLMFLGPTPTAPPPFHHVAYDPGPWFYVHMAYAYTLLVTGMVMLIAWSKRRGAHYRWQTWLLVLAALAPLAANVVTELRLWPNRDLDLTPFSFLVSAVAMLLAMFRFRLLCLVPVAHDAVLSQMRDGVLVLDEAGVVLDLNPAAERLLDLPQHAVLGQQVASVLPAWAALWEQVAQGAPVREEAEITVAGQREWFDVIVTPLAEAGPDRRGDLVVLRQITGHKRAQAALAANEQRYRTLFETSTDAIFLQTLEGRLLDCNVSACQQYGYSLEEMRQLSVVDLMPPETADWLARATTHGLTAGELQTKAQGLRRTGEVFPTEVNTRLVRIGEESLVVAYVRDVTDRTQAEERWRWSDTLLRSLAENSPLAFYVVDGRHDEVLFLNTRFCQFWGLRELEENCRRGSFPPGRTIGAALARQVADAAAFNPLWARLNGEIPRTVVEQDLPLADGRVLRWLSTQLRDAEGRYLARLHIFADITDRKRAEDAQRLAAVGQLAAGVAHEFNNILCSMRLRADLAELKGDHPNFVELAQVVIEGAQRGAQICDDLLSFSRPQPPRREPLPIEAPIEAALSLAEPQLAAAQVTVERRYGAPDALVSIDPGQIEQVCLNLVLNACHAMPHGGNLTITTAHDPLAGGQIVVQFSDTGLGIRSEDLPHIFEPFFTTKGRLGESDVPGTGLGLSVSHGLLQAHGASITVQSEWGRGATFELRFRQWHAPTTRPAPVAAPAAPSSCRGGLRRLLLAEDEDPVREAIAEALRLRGYEVMSVAAVPEARQALETQCFDLLLTDLLMPSGDGLDLVRLASALPQPPQILVMTGKVSSSLDQDLRQAGATRWLLKPFGMPELLALVDAVSIPARG